MLLLWPVSKVWEEHLTILLWWTIAKHFSHIFLPGLSRDDLMFSCEWLRRWTRWFIVNSVINGRLINTYIFNSWVAHRQNTTIFTTYKIKSKTLINDLGHLYVYYNCMFLAKMKINENSLIQIKVKKMIKQIQMMLKSHLTLNYKKKLKQKEPASSP